MNSCPHCGMIHQTTCPRIKSIEYHDNGVTVKRIEFHSQQPLMTTVPMENFPIIRNTFSYNYGASGLANSCEQDEGA